MLSLTTADLTEPDYFIIDPPLRRRLSPSMRRALQIRVSALAEEQRAAAAEFEWLYWRGDELLDEIFERQERLFDLRSILLADGARIDEPGVADGSDLRSEVV